MLQNEITRTHKKELYTSIVKKMKKIEKKQQPKKEPSVPSVPLSLPCKTTEKLANGNQVRGIGGIPDLSRFSGSSCALEYHIINKKEKYE
jgi:hypothetical protein